VIRRRLPPPRHPVWFFVVFWLALVVLAVGIATAEGVFAIKAGYLG
jgi:hypothetical protein